MPAVPHSDLPYWLALNRVKGVGPALFERLLSEFGTLEALFASPSPAHLARLGLPERAVRAICKRDPLFVEVDEDLAWLEKEGHHALTLAHVDYPALLREIPGAPPLLYVEGDPAALNRLQVAMVGSRHPTRAGRDTARMFARGLAAAGLTITSGLAAGIDGAAHQGALEGGGATVAVLGTGVDRLYPARHARLAAEVAARGALVSEFPLGAAPLAANFPRRNRIISGLSLGVVVVEANTRSGSLITARFAAEQDRELFAIPGSIHSPQSRGCHQLIRQGAKLVECVDEILEELGSLAQFQMAAANGAAGSAGATGPVGLTEDQRRLLDEIDLQPRSMDALVDDTGLDVAQVAVLLVELELRGLVVMEEGGYVRVLEPGLRA